MGVSGHAAFFLLVEEGVHVSYGMIFDDGVDVLVVHIELQHLSCWFFLAGEDGG